MAILTHVLASFLLCGERGLSSFLLNIFHTAFICFSETELHSVAQAGFKVQSPSVSPVLRLQVVPLQLVS